MYILREREGLLYVLSLYTRSEVPLVVRAWYPTGDKVYQARRSLGVDSLDGVLLRYAQHSGYYNFVDPSFGQVEAKLERGGHTTSSFREEIPVPVPKARRRGKVFWHDGCWNVETSRGREVLVSADRVLQDYATG